MTPEQCAYVAGLIDGEGCISTHCDKKRLLTKQRRNLSSGKSTLIYPRIAVLYSTSQEFINHVKNMINFDTYTTHHVHKNSTNNRDLHCLLLSSKKSNLLSFISEIEDYVFLKRKQLQSVKEILNNINIEENRDKIILLNRRGKL